MKSPMSEEEFRRGAELAQKLKKLKISDQIVIELLSKHSFGAIERQLSWLPFRKSKRPGALLIDAIRKNYSPPKETYRAYVEAAGKRKKPSLDQDSQPNS